MKLLHLADVHLGYESYGRVDPSTGLNTRLLDFAAQLERAVDTALDERVDAVLFAGDAYRTASPGPTEQQFLAGQLERLVREGIPVVMVTGNHDQPAGFGRSSALDIFSFLGGTGQGSLTPGTEPRRTPRLGEGLVTIINRLGAPITIPTVSGPLQVVGVPWLRRTVLLNREEYQNLPEEQLLQKMEQGLLAQLEDCAARLDPGAPAVLLAHLTMSSAVYSGSERSATIGRDPVFLPTAIGYPEFDYVALGHIHRHQDLSNGYRAPMVYAGSLERVDFGEADEEKGFVLVDIGKGTRPSERKVSYRHVPVPARRFVSIEAVCPIGESPTEAIARVIRQHDIDGAIVKLTYRVSDEEAPLVDLGALRQQLSPAFNIAQIQRLTDARERIRRATATREMGLGEAMDAYLANHPELADRRDELKKTALALASTELNGEGEVEI
jgi:exonuclease SbcD